MRKWIITKEVTTYIENGDVFYYRVVWGCYDTLKEANEECKKLRDENYDTYDQRTEYNVVTNVLNKNWVKGEQ